MGIKHEDGLGGYIEILEEGDDERPTRFRMLMPPDFGPPAPECHPEITERFEVIRGTLDLGVIDGQRVRLGPGDTYTLLPGVDHLPRNGGDGELLFESTLTPGRGMAEMFAGVYTESRTRSGLGQFVRIAMIFREHADAIRFPLPVRVVMATVASLARLVGVRPTPISLPAPREGRAARATAV